MTIHGQSLHQQTKMLAIVGKEFVWKIGKHQAKVKTPERSQ